MHRYNMVRLEGPLQVIKAEDMKLGRHSKLPKVIFAVLTDTEEVGGGHAVSAYGQLALEVLAFSLVWNESSPGETLSVSVVGRLQSLTHECAEKPLSVCNRVVAERVVFYVHPQVRKDAVAKLRELQHGYNGDSEQWPWGTHVREEG
jgi:hypothetical protein